MKLSPVSIERAPAASRPLMTASAKHLGFLPSPIAHAARSPALLAHMLAGFRAFDQSSLSALEREVVAMTVAFENRCSYCMALHSAALARAPENAGVLEALREGRRIGEPRLDAVRDLTLDLLHRRTAAPPDELTEENALDVALGVGVYVLSTTVNVFTGAALDAPLAPFAWTRP